jgi:hypothetical protein
MLAKRTAWVTSALAFFRGTDSLQGLRSRIVRLKVATAHAALLAIGDACSAPRGLGLIGQDWSRRAWHAPLSHDPVIEKIESRHPGVPSDHTDCEPDDGRDYLRD